MTNNYTSGQLLQMGKFKEAIPLFMHELDLAEKAGFLLRKELFYLISELSEILMYPDYDRVQILGNKMIQLAMRIPNYLKPVSKEEYYNNIKLNYDTFEPKDL